MAKKSKKMDNEYENERIALFNAKVAYLKEAIKYMFFANGGAITTLLIKFDVDKFRTAIYIFTFGVLYTILIPVFKYFSTRNLLYIEDKNAFEKIHRSQYCIILEILLKLFTTFIIYIPSLIFCFWIICYNHY